MKNEHPYRFEPRRGAPWSYLVRRIVHEADGLAKVSDQRRASYASDIVFGTASEFGFDFLRARLHNEFELETALPGEQGPAGTMQRGFYAAVVDEADSVLIDEATTPLIIGVDVTAPDSMRALYQWANQVSSELIEFDDYQLDPRKLQANLTEKPLQGSRCDALLQRDRFGVFSLQARKQSANVNEQQHPTFGTSETIRATSEKLAKQFPQLCDILDRHETVFRGFSVKQNEHGGSFLFHLAVNVNK